MKARTAVILIAVAMGLTAATKPHNWKTGTLVEEAETREVAGSTGMNHVGTYGPAVTNQAIVYATRVGYVIQGEGMGYMVNLRVLPPTLFRRSARPSVTIHGPIKYCYDKGKFYIQDEEGQEFEMVVMRKEALSAAPAVAPPVSAPPIK